MVCAVERHRTDNRNMHGSVAGTRLFAQISLLALLTVCSLTLHASQTAAEMTAATETCTGSAPDDPAWIDAKVGKGDTLSHLFKRHGLDIGEAYRIARIEEAKPLLKFRPGQTVRLKKTPEGKLGLLQYKLGKFDVLNVCADRNSWLAYTETRKPEIRINNARVIIYNSLLESASETDLSLETLYKVIHLFGWQIDFSQDLKVGDQFLVIYEELFLDGKKIGEGEIIAAELIVSGKIWRAIRFADEQGQPRYFAPDGSSVTGTFLRSPLKFGHITSSFSNNRLHPVKKVWRAHKGVDYGAPTGTPIMATGDGLVTSTGRKGGYGKTIIIHHAGVYDTLYAHLSRYAKGIAPGKRVKQGDIIGYVGSTGLATGPHLHYEFRINGVHHNPATVELPKSASIDDEYRDPFLKLARLWAGELDYLNRIPLARTENTL